MLQIGQELLCLRVCLCTDIQCVGCAVVVANRPPLRGCRKQIEQQSSFGHLNKRKLQEKARQIFQLYS